MQIEEMRVADLIPYANNRISRQEFKVLLGLYNIGEENACIKGLAKLLRRTKRLEKIDI